MKNKFATLIDRIKTKLKRWNWRRIQAILTLFLLLGMSFALYQYYNTIQSSPPTDNPQLKVNTKPKQYSLLKDQQLKLSAKQQNNKQNKQQKEPQSAIKVSSNAPQANFKNLVRPVDGKIVSVCEWYRDPILEAWKYNPGMDFKADIGTTVKAVQAGRISKISKDDFRGITIIITHNEKYKTKYANLRKAEIKSDQQVTRGQVIGEVGDSGSNKENKLHFEIIKQNKTISPAKYFN